MPGPTDESGTRLLAGSQRVRKFRRGVVPVSRHLGQRGEHRVLHFFRDRLTHDGQRWHLVERVARDQRLRRASRERRLPREHFVEHAAETVDVGTAIEIGIGHPLLGAHVRRRPK